MEADRDIFKVSKDKARAKDLFEMAKESSEKVIKAIPKNLSYKILIEYYEICVQLMTALMYSQGYKTLSHVSLIKFISKDFSQEEIRMLDQMRKFRHGAVYYGRKDAGSFYINHEKEIKVVVNKLFAFVKANLDE